jgi:hypothetical protein
MQKEAMKLLERFLKGQVHRTFDLYNTVLRTLQLYNTP